MSGIVRIVTDTSRPKHVDMFYYTSTTVDLADGNLTSLLLTDTTYGLGKSIEKSPASTTAICPGPVDRAVDASVDGPLWVPIVTQGVKAGCTTSSLTALDEVGQVATLGTMGDASTDAGKAIGMALNTDDEVWFFGLYRCAAPA